MCYRKTYMYLLIYMCRGGSHLSNMRELPSAIGNGITNNIDNSWRLHQMEIFFALLALCKGNPSVTGGFPQKGRWRGALMFSLICAWANSWANNWDADDLRCHRAQYDVTVMCSWFSSYRLMVENVHMGWLPKADGYKYSIQRKKEHVRHGKSCQTK